MKKGSIDGKTYQQRLQEARAKSGWTPTPAYEKKEPPYVLCPMCHTVFTPTPELLESEHCPACDRDFDDDDEWEEGEA